MNRLHLSLTLLMIIFFVALLGCEGDTKRVKTAKGTDFTLKNLNGEDVSLSDFKGKIVLVEFWATWCPPCRDSMPELSALYNKYKDSGFEIVAISLDESIEKVKDFTEEYKLPFIVLMNDNDVDEQYGAYQIPSTYILDKEGKVVTRLKGYAPGSIKILEKEIKALL